MTSSHTTLLHELRQFELECALPFFPRPQQSGADAVRVLEIGAGTGYQARYLAERGFAVTAMDVKSSAYRDERVFPITEYDGRAIPAAGGSFQVVFSSNVLEHVREIDSFLDELYRVTTGDGLAIHILPTPAWRFWTIFTHYAWLLKRVFAFLVPPRSEGASTHTPRVPATLAGLVGTFFPLRHGERGFTLTEMYFYTRRWWTARFESHGYHVLRTFPTGLFYANFTLGSRLSIARRRTLARVLGSTCRVYVLGKRAAANHTGYPAT